MKGRVYPVRDGFIVRFGRTISRWYSSLEEAERFLTGVRYENDKGTFDPRDYSKEKPLSFSHLADRYLKAKEERVRPRSYANLANYMARAKACWGERNIKAIGFAEIEDFLLSQKVSGKTRSNMKSCLHDFWTWLYRRQEISKVPQFPEMKFELGWRSIIDVETQQSIIRKVEELFDPVNPKVSLAIRWLSTYVSIRPGELLGIQEKHINRQEGFIVIPHPKEKRPKIIFLLEEDAALLRAIPEGVPDVFLFRHTTGMGGRKAGQKFGPQHLWKCWRKACKVLGIEGVDLYGGTRHTTVTALGEKLSPEQIRVTTLHSTNKAFERYFQGQARRAAVGYQAARNLQQTYNRNAPLKGAKVSKVLNYSGGESGIRTRVKTRKPQ